MRSEIKEAYDTLLAKEYDKAFTLYTQLAQKEEPTSFYYLGFLYFRGFGVAQDSK
ncbi:MAG TPA: sel1 repeat family protein, partial [Sulfurovum sp.]|nr:sel1 repeat family protein [Sulfurovum sp.]